MNYITIDQVKSHLLINQDFHDDDAYLFSLIRVSQEAVEMYIDKPLSEISDENGKIPDSLRHAMLLFIGNLYDHRESTITLNINEVPNSFQFLLDLYQKY